VIRGATRKHGFVKQTTSLPGSPAPWTGSFHPRIDIPRNEIAAFCGKWDVVELALFGSVLREDFRPESDIDLLVRFSPGKEYGLFQLSRMREELEAIFERTVDLVVEKVVERSENHIKRRQILATKAVIHAAG
jgi:uncharacterized protein